MLSEIIQICCFSFIFRLFVIRGKPKNEFPRLFKEWNVALMTYEHEIEPFNQKRDALVKIQADQFGVKLDEFYSHTIYNPYIVLQANQNKVPMKIQSFISLVEDVNLPKPIEVTSKHEIKKESQPPKDPYELVNDSCYDLPPLNEFPLNENELKPVMYPGGESEALKRLDKMIKKGDWIRSFEKPNTSPNSLEPSTTVLSPYISFGCLSSRLFYEKLKAVLRKGRHSKPPVSLVGQLMWREMFYVAAASEPNFNKMVGNKICRQIQWHYDEQLLNAWTFGRTGYPFIDAIMRQLRNEGWIHHLARHAVACFLTRGDLYISWEKGQQVFEELLLDADWSLNAGNWMWLSASAFYYQYYRVYLPVAFGKKTDKNGVYIRKYCPELKNYPSDLIYEPWKATLREQQMYKCILGTDYPNRIVMHEEVQDLNKSRMKRAYEIHNSGGSDDFEPMQKIAAREEVPMPIKQEVPVPFIKVEPKEEPIDYDDFC